FRSQAQRRKFAQLLVEGKITNQTFEEWNRETGSKKLPERIGSRSKGSRKRKSSQRRRIAKKKESGWRPVLFLAAFSAALLVDSIPVFAPPAWTILAFIIVKWNPNPWGVIVAGALGSVIGRYILTLYMPRVTARIFRPSENDNVAFLGKK